MNKVIILKAISIRSYVILEYRVDIVVKKISILLFNIDIKLLILIFI